MLTPSPKVKVKRQGNCPYCGCAVLQPAGVLPCGAEGVRPDRTAVCCEGCGGHSIRHSNGSQYPLEDRTDPTSAPAVAYLQ